MTTGLFLFHRDLRITDNIGLIKADTECSKLYTCFLFTPEQVGDQNKYRSSNAIQFMIESLAELSQTIMGRGGKLIVLYGKQSDVLPEVLENLNVDKLFYNRDYSPYALRRDKQKRAICKKLGKECVEYDDYYLYKPGSVLTGSNTAYKKYTPFYNAVVDMEVERPSRYRMMNLTYTTKSLQHTISLDDANTRFTENNPDILVHGGRKMALNKLFRAIKEQHSYEECRDFFIERTTHLSAYIKFGCVSIREVYHMFKKTFGDRNGINRELIWREFFAHVLYAYPEVVGESYQIKFQTIDWHNNRAMFDKWKNGTTGFPIVDACMRQLNMVGYMHNRGRMTVASFLIKTLLIDWRWGEKYFAQCLTDYDIASNNGNWQGISGTGVDMKPYFRDMNPWIQSAKYDKNAEYIKKWIPELKDVMPKDIHKWYDKTVRANYEKGTYIEPIVDYTQRKKLMLKMYENA